MVNNMTTMAANPTMAHLMASYDVTESAPCHPR